MHVVFMTIFVEVSVKYFKPLFEAGIKIVQCKVVSFWHPLLMFPSVDIIKIQPLIESSP